MQRFRFELDSVLQWRRSQLDLAECKLRDLFAERTVIQGRYVSLDSSEHEQRERVKADDVTVPERAGFDAYLRWVKLERDRLRSLAVDCDQRIIEQRQAVVAARRDYDLLEKLKARRRSEWQAGFNREIEQLAADAYLAKFNRGLVN